MIPYPPTRTADQVDHYHGTPIADPYRWLEETDSVETRAWIEAQNQLTFDYLAEIPARERIRQRLSELWDYPQAWAPVRRGTLYFQLQNSGLQNQAVLIVRDALDEPGRLLLDPNTLSADGTVALSAWSPSPNGRWLAYATSAGGSDWMTWRIRDTTGGEDLEDELLWSKFSGAAWRKDSSGFYYTRYDSPGDGRDYTGVNTNQRLYFHRTGTPQSADELIYERPDRKEWLFGPEVSDDGRYLILSIFQGTDVRNRLFFQDLEARDGFVELIAELEAAYEFIGNDGPLFYLATSLDAPRRKVIAVDTRRADRAHWLTVIEEGEDALESVHFANDELVGIYLHHARHQIRRYDRSGRFLGEIELPGPGSLTPGASSPALTGRRTDGEIFFNFGSYLQPLTVYRFDFKTEALAPIHTPALAFDPGGFVTRQVFAVSRDGARIPIFLTHRRDLQPDGQNPTLLYGYGGFNIPMMPVFDPRWLAWLEMGGVLAVANLRGGGEYGEAWHAAGRLENKQNVFDDMIACAEHLIAEKITSTPRLAIMGRSNGGLLVGACLTQRPDLFCAAVPVVGVLDMLRFERFTIGWAWVSDYGSVDDPEQFHTLLAYSPLQNLRPGTAYPATLIVTGDHDDRVVPGHSFKFAAALQAAQGGAAPTLIRIQTRGGHGAGKPTALLIDETADIWAFLARALDFS